MCFTGPALPKHAAALSCSVAFLLHHSSLLFLFPSLWPFCVIEAIRRSHTSFSHYATQQVMHCLNIKRRLTILWLIMRLALLLFCDSSVPHCRHDASQIMHCLVAEYKAGFITVSALSVSQYARCNTGHALPCYQIQGWLCHYFCNCPSLIARTMQHKSCASLLSNTKLALSLFL